MINPYVDVDKRQFWKHGVASNSVFNVEDFYTKKFDIDKNEYIATAGSCFAQHIAKRLMNVGYNFLDVEPAPDVLNEKVRNDFGYNIYSARYGNIYTTRQLAQLAEEVVGHIPTISHAWIKNNRYYDPLRPNVEPQGLRSNEEYLFHRKYHLNKIKLLFESMDVFVFTLGLTEFWNYIDYDRALPLAPGVIAGEYTKEHYEFQNLSCFEVVKDFENFMQTVTNLRGKDCKYILTVSPVPLAATAVNEHVLPATMYSKSVLRAAAGELAKKYSNIDYFPSYEIISSPWSRGIFYDVDQRNVIGAGVDCVMRVFFQQHPPITTSKDHNEKKMPGDDSLDDDSVCEEALIEGFSK